MLSNVYAEAMRGKYCISQNRYEEFYTRLVRQKLVDFLSDERKRGRKTDATMDQSAAAPQIDSSPRDSVLTDI